MNTCYLSLVYSRSLFGGGFGSQGETDENEKQNSNKNSTSPKSPKPKGFWQLLETPERGPKVLMDKTTQSKEVFLRFMYLVFLLILGVGTSISLSFILTFALCFFLGGITTQSFVLSVISLGGIFSIPYLRDFWQTHFDLYRMDDNFCGISYLEEHLNNPHWERTREILKELNHPNLGAIDKEVLRKEASSIARENPDIYQALYELADERLQWTMVYGK
jgi:hypothetical protein